MNAPKPRFGNSRGSILLIAVVMAMIMAITGVAFLMVTTHTLNNDAKELQNDKAFQAGESLLLIVTKWLLQNKPEDWVNFNTLTDPNFKSYSTNQLYVEVKVNVTVVAGIATSADVLSEVYSSNTIHDSTTFVKRIRQTVVNIPDYY